MGDPVHTLIVEGMSRGEVTALIQKEVESTNNSHVGYQRRILETYDWEQGRYRGRLDIFPKRCRFEVPMGMEYVLEVIK